MIYKRKLSKGEFWWYKFDYQNKTFTSKAIYQTKGEAKRAEAERLTNIKIELSRQSLPFKELCEKRLDYLKAYKTDAYYKSSRLILKPLVAKFGQLDTRQISKSDLNDYLLAEAERLQKKNKGAYQLNLTIRILKSLFYYALDTLEIIDKNPTKGIKLFPVDKKLKYIPPDQDIDLIKSRINGERLNLFLFVIETGARISECIRAEASDIRGDKVVLWTRKARLGNLTPRQVPFTTPLKALILPVEGRLFNSWTGHPRWLEDLVRELNLKPFNWHSLRHRKASMLAKEGKSLVEIRDFLGHTSVNTTNIYLQSIV